MKINPQISNYIDLAIERQRKIFNADMDSKFKEGMSQLNTNLDTRFKEGMSQLSSDLDFKLKEQIQKINENIDIRLNVFNDDSERHMGMLLEQFQDRLQIIKEWVKDLPTREEVRMMIREETDPLRRDFALFKIELINLKKSTNHHEVRITRLEQKTA